MKENEAVKLWCPFLNRHCVTTQCMMWEHNPITAVTDNKKDKPRGDGWQGKKNQYSGRWEWRLDAAGFCRVRMNIQAL